MEKLSCEIITDLLPLYAEELLSDQSKTLVENHLKVCENCRHRFEDLKEPSSDINDELMIEKIKDKIRSDKQKGILIGSLLSAIIVVLIAFSLTAPVYLPYNNDQVTTYHLDDEVIIQLDNGATGYELEGSKGELTLVTWTTTWDQIFNREYVDGIFINNVDEINRIYYSEYNESKDIVIYGDSYNQNEGRMTLPRLVLNYYLLLAIIIGSLFGILVFLFRKKQKVLRVFMYPFTLSIFYGVSTLLIKRGDMTTFSPLRDLLHILILTIILEMIFIQIWNNRK